jgi:D-methionine transport system permease protein
MEGFQRVLKYLYPIILPAIGSTLRMLFISMFIALLFSVVLAVIMIITSPDGLKPCKSIYKILDFITNIIRSFPIIILIVAISPFTRWIVGTSVGESAAIVPLTIAAIPVLTRMLESSLTEVDKDVIMAAKSFGASNLQIIFKVMFVEALPSIVSGLTLTIIIFLGTTTVAGAVGAGGLGAVGLTYGFQRYDDAIMYTIVFILLILVQIIQTAGKFLYKKMK